MAFNQVTGFSTTLAASMTSSQLTMVLASVTVQGHALTTADYGSVYFTINPGASNMEVVKASANSGTTFTLDSRGLAWYGQGETELASYKFAHSAGEPVIISNSKNFEDRLINDTSDQTVAGVKTFTSFPVKSGTLTPTAAGQFATKDYVDNGSGPSSYDQMILQGTAGETLVAGNVCYFKESDQRWWKTDGDVFATASNVKLGIAQTGATAGVAFNCLTEGLDITQTGLTAGSKYYISGTAAGLTATPGAISRFVGWAVTATSLMFFPEDADEVADVQITTGTSGEALTAGQWAYFKTSDSKWWRTDSDAAATAVGVQIGTVQATVAGADLPVLIRTAGVDQTQTGLVAGTKYFLATTAGAISSTQGTFPRYVGTALSATRLLMADSSNLFAIEQHGQQVYAATATGNDTYVVTLVPAPAALLNGMTIKVKLDVANTGPATINVNSLGALAIVKGVSTALETGDLVANQVITLTYNSTGTVWQLDTPSALLVTGQTQDATNLHHHANLIASVTGLNIAGSTTENTVLTATLPAGILSTKHGVRIIITGQHTADQNGDDWNIRFKLGGTTIVTLTPSAGSIGVIDKIVNWEVIIINTSTTAQVYASTGVLWAGTTPSFNDTSGTAAVDTTGAVAVAVTSQTPDDNGQAVTIRSCTFEYLYAV